MSDTRESAEEELHTAVEMSGSLEDSLGSALETSFNLPPAPTTSSKPKPDPATSLQSSGEQASFISAQPIPGLDEWKDTLEGYTKEWQAESSIARQKAEATRKKYEDEVAAKEKAQSDKLKEEKRQKQAEEKAKKDRERLARELDLEIKKENNKEGIKKAQEVLDRAQKVQEAWELVKPAGEASTSKSTSTSAGIAPTENIKSKDSPVVETDARGVTDADILAGAGTKKPVKAAAYDPTTSKDPIPPVFQDATSATKTSTLKGTESQTSTPQAWEEVSGPSSTEGSGSEDIVNVPSPSNRKEKSNNERQPQPPAQPPSLTLSLFTLPSHLSISRVFAVVGINLVLPFINGVMLGFGEIFAREVIRVGKAVWRGERTLFAGRGAGGVAGVGLSGGF